MAKIFPSTDIYLTMSKRVRNFLIYLFIYYNNTIISLCRLLFNHYNFYTIDKNGPIIK